MSMSTNHPLISIVGPTASGKTKLALNLAKDILAKGEVAGVDLISADSRQVYRAFEILSGADLGDFLDMGLIWEKDPVKLIPNYQPSSEFSPLPTSAQSSSASIWTSPQQSPYPFLTTLDHTLTLHGAAIIGLKNEWSLGHFYHLASQLISTAQKLNRQVIIVGGTMLYHDKLLADNELIFIPRNEKFRAQIADWDLAQLQAELQKIDPPSWDKLNQSDRHNPHRLTRKLEIAHHQLQLQPQKPQPSPFSQTQHRYFIPDFNLAELKEKITQRVKWRFKAGAVNEVKRALPIIGSNPDTRSNLSLPIGFNEVEQYLAEKIDELTAIELWSLHEWQYLKRQLTWWRKKDLLS